MNLTKDEQEYLEQVLNNSYILWLKTFSEKHPFFLNDSWPDYPAGTSEKDKQNIKCLPIFYYLIDKYAKNNSINSAISGNSSYYLLKIDEYFYKIGFITYPETFFFCNKVCTVKQDLFIDYIDVKNYYQPEINTKDNRKKQLEQLIAVMVEEDISLIEIELTVNKFIQNVKIKRRQDTIRRYQNK